MKQNKTGAITRLDVEHPVKISVVIVTYNRPDDCGKAVESLVGQSVQPHEVIVVDDYSFKPFKYDHPLVKVVRNSRELGLSGSRNVGIQASNGDVIAFIDDDALAIQNWVEIMHQTFRDNVDIIGGPVLPLYTNPPPRWWSHMEFGLLIGVSNELRCVIIGCNFAVRKALFESIGYFDTRLGRKFGTLLSSEENEFFQRASRVGAKIKFVPSLRVYHRVYPYRLTMLYLLRRSWWQGMTNYLANPLTYRMVLRTMKRLLSSFLKILLFPKNSRKWILKCANSLGFLFAMLKYKEGAKNS